MYVWWVYFSFAVTILVAIILGVILAASALGSVYDDIHLRGELRFSSVVLCLIVVIQLGIYVFDVYSEFSTRTVLTHITHFLYCALATVASFSVMAVSTQYVVFVAARTPHISPAAGDGDCENGRSWMSKDDVDFHALISTRHGMAGLIAYLAKHMNEQKLHHLVVCG